ncbi:unnamed protein product [Pleuronectes platessa]|uniref:Uncharacterized protein n=1 Tax=Pleuronectes platessa TaxID=8262 RepID=A0A9N7V3K3_PLEPL|nr:unnamed protein product [Pleuronectes platessa]
MFGMGLSAPTSVMPVTRRWCGGFLSFSWAAGRCPSPVRKAGRWRGPGTRSAAATLDACRALLADHLSYGARWGNPPFARGAPSGGF